MDETLGDNDIPEEPAKAVADTPNSPTPIPLAATALWDVTPALLLKLDATFGAPIDSYLNGSQVWLTADGPNEIMLEWRIHPVGGFQQPVGVSHYDVWETVIAAYSDDPERTTITFGTESRSLDSLWTGMECFAAYGDPLSTHDLIVCATNVLAFAPNMSGLVNHEQLGEQWFRSNRSLDLAQLVRVALEK